MIRRPLFLLSAAALALAVPAVAGTGSGDAALDRASAELAASLVLRDLRAELRAKPADPAALRDAMLADPAANADPAAAERNMALAHSNALAQAFAAEARALLDRLAAPQPRAERFGAAFLAEAETAPPADVAEAVRTAFPAAFRTARAEAVRAQAAELDACVRPTPAEVESVPRDELARSLAERIEAGQRTAVFHENRDHIGRAIVGPMLDDAFAQREAQRESVRRDGPGAAGFAPSVIAANLARSLLERLDERRAAEPDAYVYGPFPSATGEVARVAAEARALARFAEAARQAPVPFDERAARTAIEAAPAAHRRRDDSLRAFEPALREAVRAAAEKGLLDRAPASEREECSSFLRGRGEDQAVVRAVSDRVRGELLPRLSALRAALSDEQFAARCGGLADGSWYPDDALVDAVCAEEMDFRRTLRGWRRVPGLAELDAAAPEAELFEETAAKLDAALLAAFEPSVAARASQHKTTDGLYDEIKAQVREMEDSPDADRIAQIYAARVSLDWEEARPGVLGLDPGAEDDGRCLDLFPSVVEKIRLLAKTMLEQLEREKRDPETPPEPTPPQPDAPPEELRQIEVECDLVFDRRGDAFEVTVRAEGRDLGKYSCPAAPEAFRGSVRAFSGEAAEALAGLLRERTREGTVSLTVRLDVRDGLIYWAAVSGVTERVRDAVGEFGDAVSAAFSDSFDNP